MTDRRRRALRFVLLVGAMSLFADFVYEGARGIAGPFLATLGASGAVVGIASGVGEITPGAVFTTATLGGSLLCTVWNHPSEGCGSRTDSSRVQLER